MHEVEQKEKISTVKGCGQALHRVEEQRKWADDPQEQNRRCNDKLEEKKITEQIFNQIPKTNEECTPSAGKLQDRYALGTTWEKDDEFYKYSQKRNGR